MNEFVGELEALVLTARDARDAAHLAAARGIPSEPVLRAHLEREAELAEAAVADRVGEAPDPSELDDGDDRAALAAIRRLASERAGAGAGPGPSGASDPHDVARRIEALSAAATLAGETLRHEGEAIGRLSILARLRHEPEADRRRSLFRSLEPLWRAVDGDGDAASPYRDLMRAMARRDPAEDPATTSEAALRLEPGTIEGWSLAILEAWQAEMVGLAAAPIEPWDWWWRTAELDRLVDPYVPVERLMAFNEAFCAAVGADLDRLGVRFDVRPRRDRPPVPVAYTTFGSRPRRLPDGTWRAAVPWILATYRDGGLGELAELVHETGHAIHLAAIRARPAFADWPDSDAFTEAVADLLALDVTDPAWLGRWVDPALADTPPLAALAGRYASIAMDAAWALFEIGARREPAVRPNDIWTEITTRWLGIAPHPEWSWWAIRGQLVGSPGYMANYAIGAVLAADLRAAIRAERRDWLSGDPGWYGWVSDRLFRFGASRPAADVVREVLGREPSAAALVTELGQAG